MFGVLRLGDGAGGLQGSRSFQRGVYREADFRFRATNRTELLLHVRQLCVFAFGLTTSIGMFAVGRRQVGVFRRLAPRP